MCIVLVLGAANRYHSPPFHYLWCGVHFFRCVRAECLLLGPRLTRTLFGISLLLIGALLIWLRSSGLEPLTIVLQAGALGAVIGAGFMAGADTDRAALAVTLTHPTTPLGVATGRWIAAVAPAATLSAGCALALSQSFGSVAAGVMTAMAVGGCAIACVFALGPAGGVALFLFIAVAGVIPPERLIDFARPEVTRLAVASALELGPALWHYRDVSIGDLGAILHAGAWSALGVMMASGFVARRR